MEWFFLILAGITLAAFLIHGLESIIGSKKIAYLKDIEPWTGASPPKISVIIPALNEEDKIEAALKSILNQNYPDLEVIVINDRSTDHTGEILERMSEKYSRLRMFHITELPPGWLGKNHALQYGADRAEGEYILFTDADVHMEPTVISRAVAYIQANELDHLTAAGDFMMPSVLLKIFMITFAFYFSLYARPWRVNNPKSKQHLGLGMFNMVRKDAYESVGGHWPIRLRPDDDMMLGKIIRRAGLKQRLIFGRDMLSVEWYSSIGETVRGLGKNSFAAADYSIIKIILNSVLIVLLDLWPYAGIFLTDGITRWLNIAIVVVILVLFAISAAHYKFSRWHSLGFPVMAILFLFIAWRSMLLALINQGINWRGTHYPLGELKANKV